ncbi:MAG: NTF2-like N-terminal transpeptidase domain-containing protein, partial [Anaerolineae bacterium]
MKKLRIFLISLIILAACQTQQESDGLSLPEDSYELVTLTPLPTDTPKPTEPPVLEDAGGIGRAFYRAWEGMDFLGMYSLLAPQTQAVVDSQSFVDFYQDAMKTAVVRAISSQPLSMIQEGEEAEFGVRVTWDTAVVGSITRDFTVPLVYQQGRWGILWDESLILPELAGGDHLYLDYHIPSRANIYDINGLALAYQGSIITLGVIPGQIEDEEAMLAELSPVLNLSPEEIKAIYAPAQPDWYWPIGEVREEVMQEYGEALQPFIGKGLASPDTRLTRLYTPNGVAPHIVGYTGFIPAE